MATSNESGYLERKASELMDLAGALGAAGLGRAEREVLSGLRTFADHIASSMLGIGGGEGIETHSGLLSSIEGRYLTDDFGAGAPLGYAADWSAGHQWGGSTPGYWRLGDVDPVLIALEDDEEFQDVMSESGDVRRAVRRSMFDRPGATRGRASRATTARTRATQAGVPQRAPLWDRPGGALAHLTSDSGEWSTAEDSMTPDAGPSASGGDLANQHAGSAGATPVEWTFPYPRTMGHAGARYLTPSSRALARFSGAGRSSGANARAQLNVVARSVAARMSAGAPRGLSAGRPFSMMGPTGGFSGAPDAARGASGAGSGDRLGLGQEAGRSGSAGLLLDGLAIGETSLSALSSALRVAHAAFGASGSSLGGVTGPASIDRMLTVARLTEHSSTSGPSFREALDVDWVRPEAGDAPQVSGASAREATGSPRRASISLFDVIPRMAGTSAATGGAGGPQGAPRSTPTANIGELPSAERFALGFAARQGAAAPAAIEPAQLLGQGWSDPGARHNAAGRDAASWAGGATSGGAEMIDIMRWGRASSSPAMGHGTSPVLVNARAVGGSAPSSPLRGAPDAGPRSGRMGERIRGLVEAVALSPSEAAAVLGVLRTVQSGASPEQLMRALTREVGAAPMALKNVAEAVLLDMSTEAGLTSLQPVDSAVETAMVRRAGRRGATQGAAAGLASPAGSVARGGFGPGAATRGEQRAAQQGGGLRLSVRMPSGALVPISLGHMGARATDAGSPGARNAGQLQSESAAPLDVVLPAAGAQRALAAIPTLVQQLEARNVRSALGAAQTDAARGFALGLPETVMASLRGLLERAADPQGATAAYQGLLRHAPELGVLAPEQQPGSMDGADGFEHSQSARSLRARSGVGGSSALVGLDALRSLTDAGGTRDTSTSRDAGAPASLAQLTPAGAGAEALAASIGRSVAGPTRAASGAARGGAADRLAWSVRAGSGGGLSLELVDRAAESASLDGMLSGTPATRLPDGRLVPVTTPSGRPLPTAEALSPTARGAKASVGFADRHLRSLGLTGRGAEATQDASTGMALDAPRDYGLAGDLDLLSTSEDAGEERGADGGILGTAERLQRRTENMVAGRGPTDATSTAPGRTTPGGDLLRAASAELDLVAPSPGDGVDAETAVGTTSGARGIGRGGRRAARFQSVSERVGSSASGTTASVGGTAPGGSPLATAPRGRSRKFGLDVGFDATLVRATDGSAVRASESAESVALGATFAGRRQGGTPGSDGLQRGSGPGAGMPQTTTGGASWTQLSGLLRRMSNGGSATPLQRELASLVDGLPTAASAREATVGGSVGFSRDLLVRLETAIETLSGGRSVDDLVAGMRGNTVAATTRGSDLGASGLMSFVSPVLGNDPFSVDTASGGRMGGGGAGRGSLGAESLSHVGAPAHSPVAASALDGMDWSLVSPHAPAREGNRSTPDMGMLARTALSSGTVSRADLPLIAPATVAVATQAHLSSREDRPPEASAPANAGRTDAKKPAEAKVDLDKLAVEMANRISIMSRVQLERRGIWQSHKT